MEKVKLTPEQVKGLEKWKEIANAKQILHGFTDENKKYGWLNELECLKSLSFTEMALALCGWYEIEEQYKVGDWLHVTTPNFDFVAKVVGERDEYTEFDNGKKLSAFQFRKATKEEIAAEKERRRWAAIGREVDEYRKGDIVTYKRYGHVDVVAFVDSQGIYLNQAPRYHSADEIELVCPVEQRFDMKGDDDESA